MITPKSRPSGRPSVTSGSFGEAIRVAREALDITQEEVGRRLDVGRKLVSGIELGRVTVSDRMFGELMKALGVTDDRVGRYRELRLGTRPSDATVALSETVLQIRDDLRAFRSEVAASRSRRPGYDQTPLDDFLADADTVCIAGVTLQSLSRLEPWLKDKLEQGCTFMLILTDPTLGRSSSTYRELRARRLVNPGALRKEARATVKMLLRVREGVRDSKLLQVRETRRVQQFGMTIASSGAERRARVVLYLRSEAEGNPAIDFTEGILSDGPFLDGLDRHFRILFEESREL